MEKVRVDYLLKGSLELEAADISTHKVLENLKYDVPIKELVNGVLTEHQGIDPEHIFLASIYRAGGSRDGEAIFDGITSQDVEKLATIAATNNHRAFRVWTKLTMALKDVILGQRDIEMAFNQIDIRDCLKQHTVLATTWHIDDIRDRYPFGTTDEELFDKLKSLESALSNVANISGNEVIADNCPKRETDHEVIVRTAWATRNGETSYGDIYTDEGVALTDHPADDIVKGYIITGGSSIEQFIKKNFLEFYEDKRELMATILRFPDMVDLIKDLSFHDDHTLLINPESTSNQQVVEVKYVVAMDDCGFFNYRVDLGDSKKTYTSDLDRATKYDCEADYLGYLGANELIWPVIFLKGQWACK
ncbi:hypothetical protein EHV15_34435 [Paenibacillus oralis]|uniref:Uncharacterized protein n=1 Tax=Paenibacillus oralis TaxID=2490856 RepID=A0A3P3TC72_9BACL|nr:hypothetical protein [Paenibacillus oralis]RRJ54698.1 hypothetical protein EHV15_34435 [Paenibacillus oralis]